MLLLRFLGVALALLLFALPYEYCMAGLGLGFPFAWLHPGHGEWGSVALAADREHGKVLDLRNLGVSLAIWIVTYAALRFWLGRRRSKA